MKSESGDAHEGEREIGDNAEKQVAGFIERIESLETERAQAREKIKAEYAMAEGVGLDKAAIKQIVKDRKDDLQKTIEFRAVVTSYRKALARTVGNALGELGEWARTWMAHERKMELDEAKAEYRQFKEDLDGFVKKQGKKGKDDDDGDTDDGTGGDGE